MPIDLSLLSAEDDVLVVEDDLQNLKFLTELLKGAGMRVRSASDGALALRSIRIKPPALILLDVRMPGMDGFEVCRILKSEEKTSKIPVIFVSGLGDPAEKVKGFELGAVDYVTKPLNAQEVLMRVSVQLKLSVAQRRLEEQNHQLKEAENRFRTAANAAPVLIWMAGLDKLCNFFNQTWLSFTGRPLDQEMGNGWTEGVHPDDYDYCLDIYLRSFDARQQFSMEYRLRHHGGAYRWILDTGVPRYDEGGRFVGYIGACIDIDVLKKNEIELKGAREAAETANIAKSAFLANMSHEIRTPLNAISGMVHLLLRAGVTPEQMDKLGKIERASQHLLEIINTILDLSKIEAGKFVLDEGPIQISNIFANVVTMVSDNAKAKGLFIHQQLPPIPDGLYGDFTRIQQAILNYATNAVKFTEKGGLTLRAVVEQDTSDAVFLRFEVVDTGPGIAPEVQSRLFSAFEQADNTITRKYGGTGLGLAITRRIAEMMGGKAGVLSEPGKGSIFWMTVRLRKEVVGSLVVPGHMDAKQVLRETHTGARVLVVDDEEVNREITMLLLQDVGLVVDFAEDGAQAIQRVKEKEYALVLMDMQMPNLNGLDASRGIRQLAQIKQMPIIAMTANAFAEDKQHCSEAGMDDFVSKPVVPERLYEKVLIWLNK